MVTSLKLCWSKFPDRGYCLISPSKTSRTNASRLSRGRRGASASSGRRWSDGERRNSTFSAGAISYQRRRCVLAIGDRTYAVVNRAAMTPECWIRATRCIASCGQSGEAIGTNPLHPPASIRLSQGKKPHKQAMELSGALSNPATTDKALLSRLFEVRSKVACRAENRAASPRVATPRRTDLLRLAADALDLAGRPMALSEIHASICTVLGWELDRAALKGALSANILRTRPRFRRIGRGVYELR
jgi:hypothetical protein